MQATTQTTDHGAKHDDHHHHDVGFFRTYVFSTDHKTIGIQYGHRFPAFRKAEPAVQLNGPEVSEEERRRGKLAQFEA